MNRIITIILLFFSLVSCHNPVAPGQVFDLERVVTVSGSRGLTADTQYLYISGNTKLYKYTKGGVLLRENDNLFRKLEDKANHLCDIDIFDGDIYSVCTYMNKGIVENMQVIIFDAKTLDYKYSYPLDPQQQINCQGLAIDAKEHLMWLSDNSEYLYAYSIITHKFIRKIKMKYPPKAQRGLFFFQNNILIASDDGDVGKGEYDHLYSCNIANGIVETYRIMDDVEFLGDIEGVCVDPQTHELMVLANHVIKKEYDKKEIESSNYFENRHKIYIYCK